jgi:hypothetical protein
MNRILTLFFLTGIILLNCKLSFSDDSGQLEEALKNSVKNILNSQGSIQWYLKKISSAKKELIQSHLKLKKVIPDSLRYGIIFSEGRKIFLLIDEAPGKTELFTFVLYIQENSSILDVDVLIYQELYGGEIDDKAFRKQFHEIKNPKSLIFGRSIQGITGATISSKSITYAVRDLLLIFQTVYQSE